MQELIVDKIHFFEFLFITDRERLDQTEIITAIRISSLSESSHAWPWSTTNKKGNYSVLKTCMKSHQFVLSTFVSRVHGASKFYLIMSRIGHYFPWYIQ